MNSSWRMMMLAAAWASAAGAQDQPWYDTMKFKGDLRYRLDYINDETKADRYREQIRVRFGLEAPLADDLKTRLQFATGGADPSTRNQTLGDSFRSDEIRIDLAYLAWSPADTGFSVSAGKIEKPFVCVSDLIWDSNVNPEGAGAAYAIRGDTVDFDMNGGYLWITENPAGDDAMLYTGQAMATVKPSKNAHLLAGAGLYCYTNLRGAGMLYNEQSYGNSVTDRNAALAGQPDYKPDLVYAEDYREIEGFVEAGFDPGVPVTVYGQYVVNTAADTENTGWLAGISVGRARAVNSAEVGYNYRHLEKDAAVGLYTDIDSNGGGTNFDGHKIYLRYQAAKALQFALITMFSKKDPDGANLSFSRVEFDILVKF